MSLPISSNCDSSEFPPVTPHMVRARTVELAIGAGRSPIEIKQCDYEQAKRELTGETDFDRQQAVIYGGQKANGQAPGCLPADRNRLLSGSPFSQSATPARGA